MIQQQLREIIKEQKIILNVAKQLYGKIPVLQEELASHAAVLATEFEFLPVDSPKKLQSFDVKLGGRDQQSLRLVNSFELLNIKLEQLIIYCFICLTDFLFGSRTERLQINQRFSAKHFL